ncbi:hypothetical protein AJ79_08174 [Helicocarpus griseus UAMH5409]|uniref:Xylanolytic transcriptional activator regulatory domain-containing protein n=1 Tax=Helicocarpus griseus UAMH5409 TaxID=1447875 RepID=A0A2B7WVN9_9EURO|nr:hypothetical protein AJ79_08174 [Helicocarpus griseus UAMH5409]
MPHIVAEDDHINHEKPHKARCCGALGIACQAAPTRIAEHRPRVSSSSQVSASSHYERSLEQVLDRLSAVENSIQELSNRPVTTSSMTPSEHHSPSVSTQSTLEITTAAFEGQSSFGSATLLAKKAADISVARVPGSKLDENVYRALLSLKSNLDKHHPSPPSNDTTEVPRSVTSDLNLPPVVFVVSLIKRIKVKPPFFLVNNSWRDHLQIEKLCQKVYFPSDPIAAGSVTLMHGLLYFIIRDYLHSGDTSLAHSDCTLYADMCERSFVSSLKTYDMFVSPTLQKVQALLIGVIKCQEESNLPLCWTYLSIAFDMCQSMGYHRNSVLKDDPMPVAEEKRHAFWRLYMVDKNLSLNLGRTSHFQDHDIDCALFMPSVDPQQCPWDLMAHVTIRFSAIQGRVYDKLYSASASATSPEEKLNTMEKLSTELIEVRNELLAIDVSGGYYADSLQGIAACAEFITYSVLTVIYRAQTSPNVMTISSKCLEAAKLGLQSHLRCFPYFRERNSYKQAEYVNWILLYPSFTPFIIVFTHAIATTDLGELSLLHETVGSLELVKSLSRGSNHLYEICRAFLTIAQALIDSQQGLNGLEQHDDGSLVLPFMADGQTQITFPDIAWPEEMHDFNMDSADISVFLNDFLGTNRPGTDMLNLNFTGPGVV